ncbi:NAD(P)-binding protein [Lentithecium fluviatile CBS 122367]|uniref:NAD(P)-binding protein n=1 Tax=Lentithecium fluviatile CBS 122367 TaxID=1168545 RepID=A0A6G1J4N6_9PLEO|nr:NAD(P)-binding protein [Lentithecium fluviatile CBS 122367]
MSTKLESKASFEATPFGFLRRQFTKPKPLPAGTKLTDQVAIVTGSNVGLGLEASRQFLQLGLAHLVMGVRSQAKGDAAAAKLRKDFPSATISVWLVDLESYESVQAFVEKCAALPRIDIAILNAGLVSLTYAVVPGTKHELTLQVNYLSTVLLAILLLPLLKAKKAVDAPRPPVISIVGSDLAYGAKLDSKQPILKQFEDAKGYAQFPWYGKSKLLLIPFVAKLAEFVSPDDVLINIANPGMTKGTDFFRGFPAIMKKIVGVAQLIVARSVSTGASLYVDAAVAQGKDSHGSFTSDWAIKPYPKLLYSPAGQELREKLWDETLAELEFAGAGNIVKGLAGKSVAA